MTDMTQEMQGRMVLAASAGEHGLVAQQLAALLLPALEDAARYRHMVEIGDRKILSFAHGEIHWHLAKGEKADMDGCIDLSRSATAIQARKEAERAAGEQP